MADTMIEPNTGALIPATALDPVEFQNIVRTALEVIGGAVGTQPGSTPAVETREMRGAPLVTTACTLDAVTGDVTLSADDGTSIAVYELSPPNGVTLTSVKLWHTPGTHAVLPSVPVSMSLDYISLADGVSHALFASTPDPTTPAAAYSVYHGFSGTVTSSGHTVARATEKYLLTVVGENDGTHGATGGLLRAITATWTRPAGMLLGHD